MVGFTRAVIDLSCYQEQLLLLWKPLCYDMISGAIATPLETYVL